MDDWRRNRSEYYHNYQVIPRAPMRSQYRRPPPGSWQPTVPSWEKKFVTQVGAMPWGRFLDKQRELYIYKDVLQWDDSAGEEAFRGAKNRFWAEINGLPSDISLPDPDMYNDDIDWNTEIDPELLLDLEREPEVPDEEEKDVKAAFVGDSLFYMNQPVVASGWGDEEDDPIKTTDNPSAECGLQDGDKKASEEVNPWEQSVGSGEGKPCSWADWGVKMYEPEKVDSRATSGSWGASNENWRKRESSGQYLSRYKTTRYHRDDYQTDHGWRNNRGNKRVSFANEHSLMDKKPLAPRQWNSIQACGPISHHRPGEARNSWNWDKQVSYHIN